MTCHKFELELCNEGEPWKIENIMTGTTQKCFMMFQGPGKIFSMLKKWKKERDIGTDNVCNVNRAGKSTVFES